MTLSLHARLLICCTYTACEHVSDSKVYLYQVPTYSRHLEQQKNNSYTEKKRAQSVLNVIPRLQDSNKFVDSFSEANLSYDILFLSTRVSRIVEQVLTRYSIYKHKRRLGQKTGIVLKIGFRFTVK
jgi:hypothetical protein